MSAEASELTPPVLTAGVVGSTIILNWTYDADPYETLHELTVLTTGQIYRTETNSQSLNATDGLWSFRVAIYTKDGRVATSNDVSVVVENKIPEIPVVSLRRDGIVVSLEWVSVPNAMNYEVVCNGTSVGEVPDPGGEQASIQFVHHAWHDGVYNYEVRARDARGRWSPFSSPVTHIVDTAPPNPPVVEVVARGLKVRVQWRQPEGKAVRYHLRCNGEDIGTTDKTWFDTVVNVAGPYSFRVQTEDLEGRFSEWSEVTEFSSTFVGRRTS